LISTLHGKLPLCIIPDDDVPVSMRGRMQICKVRGNAFGQNLNFEISLDIQTGEMLLMAPDAFVGSFRLGDLIAAQVTQMVARAQRERDQEAGHAQAH
jgi:hypothetical protein